MFIRKTNRLARSELTLGAREISLSNRKPYPIEHQNLMLTCIATQCFSGIVLSYLCSNAKRELSIS